MRRKWSCHCGRQLGLVHCGLRRHVGDRGDVETRERGGHGIGIVEGIGRSEEWHDVKIWLSHRLGTSRLPRLLFPTCVEEETTLGSHLTPHTSRLKVGGNRNRQNI